MRSRTDIGINESRFLFVLDVMVLNLLHDDRSTYSLCIIYYCHDFIGFTQYLFFMQTSECGLFEISYFTLLLIFTVAWGTSGDNTQYCCLDMFFISA